MIFICRNVPCIISSERLCACRGWGSTTSWKCNIETFRCQSLSAKSPLTAAWKYNSCMHAGILCFQHNLWILYNKIKSAKTLQRESFQGLQLPHKHTLMQLYSTGEGDLNLRVNCQPAHPNVRRYIFMIFVCLSVCRKTHAALWWSKEKDGDISVVRRQTAAHRWKYTNFYLSHPCARVCAHFTTEAALPWIYRFSGKKKQLNHLILLLYSFRLFRILISLCANL